MSLSVKYARKVESPEVEHMPLKREGPGGEKAMNAISSPQPQPPSTS